jgi:hypothetical protein
MFMKLAAKVQEWITHNEWSDKIAFDEENQTSSVSFIYIINEQPFKVWVETDENKDMVSVYIYAPFNALPNKLNDCSILFNHINNNTVWGGIACDENGSIRWRHSVDFEDTDPSVAAIENAFRVGGSIFKTWYDKITSVALTKVTAQELINHSNAAPEPEGVVAFDEYVATQDYPSPLKIVH